jgi:hypothetical protein
MAYAAVSFRGPRQSGLLHIRQNFLTLSSASALARSTSGPICDTSCGGANIFRSAVIIWRRHQSALCPSRITDSIPRKTTSRARASSMLHLRFNGGVWFYNATKTASAARNYGVPANNIDQGTYFTGLNHSGLDALHLRPAASGERSIHPALFLRAGPGIFGQRSGFSFQLLNDVDHQVSIGGR